jgi:hypothetical protein
MPIRAATLRFLAARIAPLWLAVYLATPLKPYVPTWAFAVIIVVPFLLLLLEDGEERVTARGTFEVIAAWWYVALTALVFYFFLKGYRPPGWWVALIFIGIGLVVYVPKLRHVDEISEAQT